MLCPSAVGRLLILVVVIGLCACVSGAIKPFVGKPIEEARIAYGEPENVIELADGRTAYQFRIGGSGGQTRYTDGCLITLIARNNVIEEYRIPRQAFC